MVIASSPPIASDRARSKAASSVPRALQQADLNFNANRSALLYLQPSLARELADLELEATYLFARDGYLTSLNVFPGQTKFTNNRNHPDSGTTMDTDHALLQVPPEPPTPVSEVFRRAGFPQPRNSWFSNCSVPFRAAKEFLKKLEMIGAVGCFLNPTHAAQLRAVFEKIAPTQGIIAVVPQLQTAHQILHCDDFSLEISAGRLLFAVGQEWDQRLGEILQAFLGLPLPEQFLRTALLDDEAMAPYIEKAQKIISLETERRAQRIHEIRSRQPALSTGPARLLVVSGSRFNLSDWSGHALASALLSENPPGPFTHFDPDHLLTASPLAMAESAQDAGAVITVDLFRSDLPGIVPPTCPWITWVTAPRIAPPATDSPADGLLLTDPIFIANAKKAGWDPHHVEIAAWPALMPHKSARADAGGDIVLLVDTRKIEAPPRVLELSSQMLLWEKIEFQLRNNPFALGADPGRYLSEGLKEFGIAEDSVDRRLFIDRLILPAYHQGLAKALSTLAAPLSLHGAGWQQIPEFAPYAKGPVQNLQTFITAIQSARLLINPSPDQHGAALASAGVPVLQPAGKDLPWLKNAIHPRRPKPPASPPTPSAPLSPGRVLSLLPAHNWPPQSKDDCGSD
jgi:hypothetical protein